MTAKFLIFFVAAFVICEGRSYKEYKEYGTAVDLPPNENFYLSKTEETYYEALQICREKSMQLVSIETSEKNKELSEFLKNPDNSQGYWTSGSKISTGEWWWLKGEPLKYQNWINTAKPTRYRDFDNDYNRKCIKVIKNGSELLWTPDECNHKSLFICENLSKVSRQDCNLNKNVLVGADLSNRRYYVGEDIVTYSKAAQMCRSMCMDLISIENEQKNQDVFQALSKAGADKIYWSSGYYKPSLSIWKWINGETAEYFSWNHREPNNLRHNEYCIEINKNDETVVWNDQPCEEKRMFVCEAVAP